MMNLLSKYSFGAICLAVLVEEMGLPMPIPTDLLIVFAGASQPQSLQRLVLWFLALSIASATGASGLYAAVRRGGRPIITRFGRYVHLGPEQLARSESLLARGGWLSIAVGRAIPGLRLATVIACGLLRIPYHRFLTAHLVGSSLYIVVFLALGRIFGTSIVRWLDTPLLSIRLLGLLVLAFVLPALLRWWSGRIEAPQAQTRSPRHALVAALSASFVGAIAFAALWATAATLAELGGAPRPLNVTYALVGELVEEDLSARGANILAYAALPLLCMSLATVYFELVLPRLSPRLSLNRQVGSLALLDLLLIGSSLVIVRVLIIEMPTGGWLIAIPALVLGSVSYAITTVHGRALALAVRPTLRGSTTG